MCILYILRPVRPTAVDGGFAGVLQERGLRTTDRLPWCTLNFTYIAFALLTLAVYHVHHFLCALFLFGSRSRDPQVVPTVKFLLGEGAKV